MRNEKKQPGPGMELGEDKPEPVNGGQSEGAEPSGHYREKAPSTWQDEGEAESKPNPS